MHQTIVNYTLIIIKNNYKFSLVLLLTSAFLWSFGQFLEYSTKNVDLILLYTKILHTGSIMLMKEAKISLKNNPLIVSEKMSNILSISEKMLKDLRFSVMELKSGKNPDIIDTIDSFAEYIRCMGVVVKISVIGQEQYEQFKTKESSLLISDALYKVCREAVTNSLRHGNATEIAIIMKFSIDSVKMFIIDNGQGCIEIKKGIGLTGMVTRVKGVGGSISYGSNDEKGSSIKAVLCGLVNIDKEFAKNRDRPGNVNYIDATSISEKKTELTCMEYSILRKLVEGKSSKEIAFDLGISYGSLRNKVSQMLSKYNMKDRTELAIFALENDFV